MRGDAARGRRCTQRYRERGTGMRAGDARGKGGARLCEARGARMRAGAARGGVGRTAVQRERARNALAGAAREGGWGRCTAMQQKKKAGADA